MSRTPFVHVMIATKLLARGRPHLPRLSRLSTPPLTCSRIGSGRLYQSNANKHNLQSYYEEYQWIPSLMGRLAAAFGMIHIISEYGFELTLCEGPSMLPTIHPYGEIILVDRLSPRLNGMEGGNSGEARLKRSRERQEDFEANHPDDDYQWHEPMIAVNEWPSDQGVWNRFWKQLATPVSVGDVVVVQHPDRRGTVCKRILGLPGDMVVKPPHTMRRRRRPGFTGSRPDNNLLVIPDGHIWIEGDNSMNSSDSRTYGPIPAAMIVGRVLCRIWPLRGSALMQRGARPMPPEGAPFSGSTVLPAGYEGEEIIKTWDNNAVASKRTQTKKKEERT